VAFQKMTPWAYKDSKATDDVKNVSRNLILFIEKLKEFLGMVSGINSVSSNASQTAAAATNLSSTTKSLLQSLGIDATSITSEAQAKVAIAQAKEKKPAQGQQKTGASQSSDQTVKQDAQSLAAQLGVVVGTDDEVDEILDKISTAIDTLQSAAGQDPVKLQQVKQYQTSYALIDKEYEQQEANKTKLQNSMNAMAAYNMASIAISGSK
jgi:hypothetical protein